MIRARINEILQKDGIHSVGFIAGGIKLRGVFLQLSSELKVGSEVYVGFKSTDVLLSREALSGVSSENEVHGKITSLSLGEILCTLRFEGKISFDVLISAHCAQEFALREGDEVFAYISATAIYIEKYDND